MAKEKTPIARLVLDSQYWDNDGEFMPNWSDDFPNDIILLEEVSAKHIFDKLTSQNKYHITIGIKDIQEWLDNEPDEMPLYLWTGDYVPYKGWSDPNPGSVEGKEDFIARLETFKGYVKSENSWLADRFQRNAI